jgi:hypothetical protein
MSLTLTLLTPLLAFAGALLGVVLNRRGAHELERRSVREETMRNVRWAAELAIAGDEARARLGVAQLRALALMEPLEAYETDLVKAALATMEPPIDEVQEA